MPVLSLQVPEKEPRNATYVYWLWHSIYQENADLFPPPPCTGDIMGSLTLRIMVRCRLRVTDVCFLLKFMRADAAAAERTPIPVSHTFPPRDKLSPHKNLSPRDIYVCGGGHHRRCAISFMPRKTFLLWRGYVPTTKRILKLFSASSSPPF